MRASDSATPGPSFSSSSGSTSTRVRDRANAGSALLGSCQGSRPSTAADLQGVRPPQAQERAEQPAPGRPHPGQGPGARAARQAQQHLFGLVIQGVAEQDGAGARSSAAASRAAWRASRAAASGPAPVEATRTARTTTGERDPAQDSLARKGGAMFPHRLQDAERPAEALPHQPAGVYRSFGVSQSQIFVFDAIAQLKQSHGEVGILGHSVGMEAAGLSHRGDPPCAYRAGNHADRAHGVQGAAFEILAGDVLKGLPARPKVNAIADFCVARHGSDFGIQEMGHKTGDSIVSNHGVSVNANEHFFITQVLPSKVEGIGLARVGLGQDEHPACVLFACECRLRHFERLVARAVIDHNHAQVGISSQPAQPGPFAR